MNDTHKSMYLSVRHNPAMCTLALVLLLSPAIGRNLYVTPGTGVYPTIQSAASVASAGDSVIIRAGIYHETVTPANSGTGESSRIVFTAAPGESVTVTAADEITGWTPHDLTGGRKIYKAAMNWTLCSGTQTGSAGMDQVFADGTMMVEARWPNLPDSVNPCAYRREYGSSPQSGSTASSCISSSYTDSRLSLVPQTALDNAYIHSIAAAYWTPMTGLITAHSSSGITFAHPAIGNSVYYLARGGDWYYVWGTLGLLDAPREWHRGSDGTLYLWMSGGDDPSRHRVEGKRRQNVFVLDGRSYITIRDLLMLAGGIGTTAQTAFLTLDNVDCRYISHYSLIAGPWSTRGMGLNLKGEGTVVTNSHFAYSAESVLLLTGRNARAQNNVVHDGAYLGCNGYVLAINDAENGQLLYNTSFGCGTNACIDLRRSLKCTVMHNDVFNGSRITTDGGMVMATRDFDGQGAEVSYNHIHDGLAPNDGANQHYGTSGFYCEGNTQGYTIHHNIIWNTTGSGIALGPGGEGSIGNFLVCNNTIWGSGSGTARNITCGAFAGTLKNNSVGAVNRWSTFTGVSENNFTIAQAEPGAGNLQGSYPGYSDTANCDFRPRAGSALIDRGQVITGITDGYAGAAPDIGALESGRPVFVAGAVITSRHIGDLKVTWDNTAFPDKKFTVSGMPLGRKVPADFKLKIGGAPASGMITYNIKTGVFTFTGVSPGTLAGAQPIYGQIGTGTPVATGETINLDGSTSQRGRSASAAGRRAIIGRGNRGSLVVSTGDKTLRRIVVYSVAGSARAIATNGNGQAVVDGASGSYWVRVGGRLMRVAVVR